MKNKAINGKREKIITKKFAVVLVVIFFLMGIPAYFCAEKIADDYDEKEISEFTANKWDSDAKLIDDRLPEDYPMFFIISPMLIENVQSANVMALYNDGKYISELYTYESYDSFQEQLNSSNAFWEQLKGGYSDFKDSDWAYISTSDITPEDIRETYLRQYSIEDFSLNTQMNMAMTNQNSFFIFGMTYDDDANPESHLYYGQTANSNIMTTTDEGQALLTDLAVVLAQDVDTISGKTIEN